MWVWLRPGGGAPGVPLVALDQMRTALVVLLLGAPLRVGCDCGESAPPATLGLTLADPKTGAKDVLTTQPAVLEVTGDERGRAWCVGEGLAEAPAADAPCWRTERPTRLTLSGGDGPKTVRLWVLDRYSVTPRGAEARISVTGAPPPITFDSGPRRVSFSRQAATPLSGGCTEPGGAIAVAGAVAGTGTCGVDLRWTVVVDFSPAAEGTLTVTGTQTHPTTGLASAPTTHAVVKDTAACRDATPRAQTPFAGGAGTAADPYRVCTAAQLQALAQNRDAVAQLRDDVDLAGRAWTPIGTDMAPFDGVFDGQGFTVHGLESAVAAPYVGLFGSLDGVVKNLTVAGVNLTVGDYSGALVGYQGTGAQILDCHSSGTLTCSGCVHIGGLVGQSHGDITDSDSSVVMLGAGYAVGGLVGHAYAGTIRRCFATGAVTGTGGAVGGLIGRSEIDVFDAYATGATDSGGAAQAGGLVGELISGTLTRCHATGRVTGGAQLGGLMGVCAGTSVASYWDTQTSGQTTSPGGTGLSTAQMQTATSFDGWDFATVWVLDPARARHPLLRR